MYTRRKNTKKEKVIISCVIMKINKEVALIAGVKVMTFIWFIESTSTTPWMKINLTLPFYFQVEVVGVTFKLEKSKIALGSNSV